MTTSRLSIHRTPEGDAYVVGLTPGQLTPPGLEISATRPGKHPRWRAYLDCLDYFDGEGDTREEADAALLQRLEAGLTDIRQLFSDLGDSACEAGRRAGPALGAERIALSRESEVWTLAGYLSRAAVQSVMPEVEYFRHARNCWATLACDFNTVRRRTAAGGTPPANLVDVLGRMAKAIAGLGWATQHMHPDEDGLVQAVIPSEERESDIISRLRIRTIEMQRQREALEERGEHALHVRNDIDLIREAMAALQVQQQRRVELEHRVAMLERATSAPKQPDWAGGEVIDAKPAIRCWPEVGVVFAGPDGPVLSIDPLDGGNVSLVHVGDVVEYQRSRDFALLMLEHRRVMRAVDRAKGDADRLGTAAALAAGPMQTGYLVDIGEPELPIGPVLVVGHYRGEFMCEATLHPEQKPSVIGPWGSADLDLDLQGLSQAVVCERAGHLGLLLIGPGGVMEREPLVLRHGSSFTAGETTLHFLRDEPLPGSFYTAGEDPQIVGLARFKAALAARRTAPRTPTKLEPHEIEPTDPEEFHILDEMDEDPRFGGGE